MTLDEVLSHIWTAAATAGPSLGYAAVQRYRAKTAESILGTEIARAVADATQGLRTSCEQSASIAHDAVARANAAMELARKCEEEKRAEYLAHREEVAMKDSQIDSDSNLIALLSTKVEEESRRTKAIRSELDTVQELLRAMTEPRGTSHRGTVE